MNVQINIDPHRLFIFHEGRKRRIFIGELRYLPESDQYEFIYDEDYIRSKNAIPLGVELDIFKIHHFSKKGNLFPSLMDRIPLKSNPAYEDYCFSQGISPEENNLIILLGSIGRRGPSTFVFEPVYTKAFSISEVTQLRENLNITQHDLAKAFDLKQITLQKIEAGKSQDANTLKRLQIYLEFPEVALWQLKQTGCQIHYRALSRLVKHFKSL